jgi:5-formyltetrahydrofolate cyclo-ligase
VSKEIQREEAKHLLNKISYIKVLEKSISLSLNLAEHLQNILKNSSSFSIGGFSPIQKECLWYVDDFFLSQTIYVPTIKSETEMDFVEVSYDDLIEKKLNLKVDDALVRSIGIPDVLIIPGLLFDKRLNRLGRGAGYYDRYLADFKGLKIGVCFDEQITDEVQVDENDIKVDLLITNKEIYIRGSK